MLLEKKSGLHCWVERISLIKKVSEVSRLGRSETGLKASQGVRDLERVETRGSSLEKTVCKEGLGKWLCQKDECPGLLRVVTIVVPFLNQAEVNRSRHWSCSRGVYCLKCQRGLISSWLDPVIECE